MNITLSLSYQSLRLHRIAVSIYYFLMGLTFASWASRIPDIKNYLHLSDAQFGGVLLGLPAGQIVGIALSGYLVTRFGSKPVAIAAGAGRSFVFSFYAGRYAFFIGHCW